MTGLSEIPPPRILVVGCPDWPLVALGVDPAEPALVLSGGRVVATTPAARSFGVVRGQRRRDAQLAHPEVRVLERDVTREARSFEAVASALGSVTPWVEAHHPGRCAFGVRGPVRLFGGEAELVERTAEVVHKALVDLSGPAGRPNGGGTCRIGVADGMFAAVLAARMGGPAPREAVVVPPGGTPAFLAPLPVGLLSGDGCSPEGGGIPVARRNLVDVLGRLGLATMGAFAAVPTADVAGRFGAEGLAVHRLAAGLDDRPPGHRPAPPDLAVSTSFDPPVDRVDRAAFAARMLAESLHEGLSRRGMACTRVLVEVETGHGERLSRAWRDEGALGPAAVADRVRWQLEGWLHGPPAIRPTAPMVLLALVPDEVVPATGQQLGFWGGATAADEQAGRAAARVVGLLGPGAVRVPEWRGGRDPDDEFALVPFIPVDDGSAGERVKERGATSGRTGSVDEGPPWPGALPGPSPAAVHAVPVFVALRDAEGRPVVVDGRGNLSAPPHWLRVGGGREEEVAVWAGPWPVDERWWDPLRHRRRVRVQVVAEDGTARLLVLDVGRWRVAATYD